MKHSFRKKRRFIPLFILGAAALAAGLGGLLMALWNEALVPAAGVATIGFWQAMGLLVLSRILLGGRFGGRWGHRHHWMREKWNAIRNQQGSNTLGQKNPFRLQQRLWIYLLQCSQNKPETKWSELTSKEQNKLIHVLTSQAFEVKGKTTFKEEFVTCGGISLDQIDPNTMQSKLIDGLFFGGEILDVDGITGGYNFQHAWTSGYLAAATIAAHSKA